jgi:alpha-L-fucosidase
VADSIALAWNPVNFNAKKIIDFAIRAGCKYIVVIAKHHDGFGIWNSKYTDFDVKRLRFKKDILKELGEECHRRGLLFGIYYSIADLHYTGWNSMPTAQDKPPEPKGGKAAFVAFCQNQVRELITRYNPDIIWFDGYWLGPVWNRGDGKQLYSFIKSIKSNILTTRLSSVKDSTGHGFFATDGSSGDYFSYEAKTTDAPSFPWEACTSITYPVYGYEPNARMLSKKQLVTMFDKVICGNGNLLLSIGPERTGELPGKHIDRFLEFSDWVKANREAVYHTSGGPFRQGAWGGSTYTGNKIYLHLREPANDIKINTLAGYEITAAKDLVTGKDLEIKKDGDGYTISTPIFSDGTLIRVVELKLNKQYIFTGWQSLIQ